MVILIWKNPYVKILERSLKIVEFEVAKVSTKYLLLDNLVEEILENIKSLVN